MEQRTRQDQPIPRRRLAGSKLGQPRSIREMYPDISPQAAATWAAMLQMNPPPPVVVAWRRWNARQRKQWEALQLKQRPPTAGGSS